MGYPGKWRRVKRENINFGDHMIFLDILTGFNMETRVPVIQKPLPRKSKKKEKNQEYNISDRREKN